MSETNENTINRFSPDKFPCLLENPAGYRKGSDDYAVTLAVPLAYVAQLQPLMQKAGRPFVAFLVQVSTPEQAESMMQAEVDPPADGAALPSPAQTVLDTVSVEEAAQWLCMSPRNVQILEKQGICHKDGRGNYKLKESVQGYIREISSRGDGKNSDYNRERTEDMRLKRLKKEREHEEAMRRLVAWDGYKKAREQKDSDIKQRILSFEKILPQKTGGLSANEQVPIIRNEIRKLLIELAATERPVGCDSGSGQNIPAASGSDGKSVGGRKKKARKQN